MPQQAAKQALRTKNFPRGEERGEGGAEGIGSTDTFGSYSHLWKLEGSGERAWRAGVASAPSPRCIRSEGTAGYSWRVPVAMAAVAMQVEIVGEEEWAGLEAAIAAAEQARAPAPAVEQAPPKRARVLPASMALAAVSGAKPAAAEEGATLDPPLRFTGSITYAHTAVEVDWLAERLLASGVAVVGLDIEWKVGRGWRQAASRTRFASAAESEHPCLCLRVVHCLPPPGDLRDRGPPQARRAAAALLQQRRPRPAPAGAGVRQQQAVFLPAAARLVRGHDGTPEAPAVQRGRDKGWGRPARRRAKAAAGLWV